MSVVKISKLIMNRIRTMMPVKMLILLCTVLTVHGYRFRMRICISVDLYAKIISRILMWSSCFLVVALPTLPLTQIYINIYIHMAGVLTRLDKPKRRTILKIVSAIYMDPQGRVEHHSFTGCWD